MGEILQKMDILFKEHSNKVPHKVFEDNIPLEIIHIFMSNGKICRFTDYYSRMISFNLNEVR